MAGILGKLTSSALAACALKQSAIYLDGSLLLLSRYMKGRPDLIEPQDLKYVKVDPDADFDPKRNEEIIENTIKWTDRIKRERDRQALEGIKERVDAAGTYIKGISCLLYTSPSPRD